MSALPPVDVQGIPQHAFEAASISSRVAGRIITESEIAARAPPTTGGAGVGGHGTNTAPSVTTVGSGARASTTAAAEAMAV